MNFDSDSQQQRPSQQSRRWIADQLQLEEVSGSDSVSLKTAALPSFFKTLEEANYAVSEAKLEAIELAFGRPVESTRRYLQDIESKQLEQIDSIIADVATQLKNQDAGIDLEDLEKRLSDFSTQNRLPKVSHYANQVLETATMADFSCVAPNPLSKQIAAAVFHISAVRPSKRVEIQNQYVEEISPLGVDACGKAISGIDTRQLNLPSHLYQFFLEDLNSEEIEISDFSIASPIPSTSASLHPYKHDFGTFSTGAGQQNAGQQNAGLPAIFTAAVVVFALVIMALKASKEPSSSKTNRWNTLSQKHPVIIFDKHDPNKYAIKMVKTGQEIGRPGRLEISPEHPGPFVNVPLSEIDPVEITTEDIENDAQYQVLKILSGIRKSKGPIDD